MVIKKKRTLIVCAGAPRAGSTWLYNAVRLLIATCLDKPVYGAWVDDYDRSCSVPIHLVKVHEIHAELAAQADVVFSSHRDLRDVAVSVMRMGWVRSDDELLAFLKNSVTVHRWWERRADYDMRYENMAKNGSFVIAEVARVLGIAPGESEISVIQERLHNQSSNIKPGDRYDKISLLHAHHRYGGEVGVYKRVLTKDQIGEINRECASWLKCSGYL